MRRHFRVFLAAASALTWIHQSAAAAGTLRVCSSGCQYSSIQTAIDAAQTGDTIRIAPGTYTENLHMVAPVAAKILTLRGTAAAPTIVDGGQQDCVMQVDSGYSVTIRETDFHQRKIPPCRWHSE